MANVGFGHLQTSPAGLARSALPLEADIDRPGGDVGFGPKRDMPSAELFDAGTPKSEVPGELDPHPLSSLLGDL